MDLNFLILAQDLGGSCFKKDILNIVYLSEFFGLPEVASFWESVIKLNNWQQHRISKLIVRKLFGTLSNKKIVILGFAFKANTNDTRESPAINVCKDLLEEGACLVIHDPKVSSDQINFDLKFESSKNFLKDSNSIDVEGKWHKENDLMISFKDADAVVLLTEWSEYKKINWKEVSENMRKPSWIFDTRSLTNPVEVRNAGLNLWRIGDGL